VANFAIDIDGEVIGVIGLDFRDDVYRKAPLLGSWISENFWDRGIMTESIKLISNYGLHNLDIILCRGAMEGGQ
jgi:ribosomal-protein-alanine N-acetyltransferase